jgi:hypothetical protein
VSALGAHAWSIVGFVEIRQRPDAVVGGRWCGVFARNVPHLRSMAPIVECDSTICTPSEGDKPFTWMSARMYIARLDVSVA